MNFGIIESCIGLLSIKQLYNDLTYGYAILDFKNEELISLSSYKGNKMSMNIEEVPMKAIEGIVTQFYKNNFKHEIKIFSMRGKLVGKNLIGFPIREKRSLIEFYSGNEVVVDGEKRWTRITQSTSVYNVNSPDKLFSAYIKGKFSLAKLREMQALADSLKEDLWSTVND